MPAKIDDPGARRVAYVTTKPVDRDLDARQRYLAKYSRYNRSVKGQRRNLAYERRKKRGTRWEPARNALHSPLPPGPETPMHNGADLPPEVSPE